MPAPIRPTTGGGDDRAYIEGREGAAGPGAPVLGCDSGQGCRARRRAD